MSIQALRQLFTLRRGTLATIWSILARLWPSKSLQSRASWSASSTEEVLKSSGWWMMLTLLQNLGENSGLSKVALQTKIYANIYIYIMLIYIFMLLCREKEKHQLPGDMQGRQCQEKKGKYLFRLFSFLFFCALFTRAPWDSSRVPFILSLLHGITTIEKEG